MTEIGKTRMYRWDKDRKYLAGQTGSESERSFRTGVIRTGNDRLERQDTYRKTNGQL